MIRKRLASVAIVGGLALAGSPGYAAADAAVNQQFTIVTVGSAPGTVIARGPITGVGSDTNNRAQLPPGSPFQSTFRFRQGDLFTTVSAAGRPQVDFNPTTCVATVVARDVFEVTGGTATLARATGGGTATAHVTLIGGRGNDGNCLGPDSPPVFQFTVTQASGTVSLA